MIHTKLVVVVPHSKDPFTRRDCDFFSQQMDCKAFNVTVHVVQM